MLIVDLLSILAPHDCLGCQAEGALLCAGCCSSLAPAVPRCYSCQRYDTNGRTCAACRPKSALYAVHAVLRYEGLAKQLVWKLKFARARAAASEMAGMLTTALPEYEQSDVIVTHAPTASTRVRQRGYDQAALVAKAFARTRGLPYASLLARRGTTKQVGASRSTRKQQLANAFRPIHAGRIAGATVLLVDDVITTAATLEAAAAVLQAAGARRIIGVTFAQA